MNLNEIRLIPKRVLGLLKEIGWFEWFALFAVTLMLIDLGLLCEAIGKAWGI